MLNVIQHNILNICKNTYRSAQHIITKPSSRLLCIEHLKTRSLIKAGGADIGDFLQGIITNDIHHLGQSTPAIYTMFLNVQGRVMFDSIIFKGQEDSFILECDSNVVQPLINHLKLYKVRRKISFEAIDNINIWVLFDSNINTENICETDIQSLYVNPSSDLPESVKNELPKNAILARDPRILYLGHRILLPTDYSLNELTHINVTDGQYKSLRYKLGVGEGSDDLPRGKCLPLEANCDYLHGVSFQKGCYIGQELTARTYHTGVIRKRHMPLIFSKEGQIEPNTNITNEKGKVVGKTVNSEGKYGIGLMRIQECLEALSLNIGDINVTTFKPGWWPIEIAKQRQ